VNLLDHDDGETPDIKKQKHGGERDSINSTDSARALDEDMERLKEWLLEDDDSLPPLIEEGEIMPVERGASMVDGIGTPESSTEEIYAQIEALKEENRLLRERLEKLLEGLPEDRDALLSKETELKELEELLKEKELKLREMVTQEISEGDIEKRFQEELREKEEEFRKMESEYRSRIEQLEEELEKKERELRIKEEELRIAKMALPEADKELTEKYKDLKEKEESMRRMEEEIKNLKAELAHKDEELKKIKELLKYKESELGQREEDLLYREHKLEEERRRLEEAKKEISSMDELEMKKRIEALKEEIELKEKELKQREEYLRAKERELQLRERKLIEEEIEAFEEERAIEIQQKKVKTGNRRLDDLLLGGFPLGCNVLIHGPPFVGKEVMVGQFMAEGVKKGIPIIWVLTDKTPDDIRNEMKFILSGYEEYENIGLVKYVDLYSMTMELKTDDPNTIYLEDPADHSKISFTVDEIAKEIKENDYEYYRLAFRSLSTLIAYSDPVSTFRFLGPFCGKRKRDNAVCLYTLEKGMHGDQEIQMISSVMDGMIDFKVDQLKTYFAVQGVTDVQSRSYIRYTATKSGLSIGSFSLDHIR